MNVYLIYNAELLRSGTLVNKSSILVKIRKTIAGKNFFKKAVVIAVDEISFQRRMKTLPYPVQFVPHFLENKKSNYGIVL